MSQKATTCTRAATAGLSRREFLRRSALLGAGLCATSLAPLAAQAARLGSHGHAVSATRVMCGTLVHITAVHPSRDLAEEAVGRAYEEMQRLAAIFDRHKTGTAVSVLNDQGRLQGAPAELAAVMDRALRFHALSEGAFDATVAPVVDLFKSKARHGQPLEFTQDELDAALQLVGAQYVSIAGSDIRFARSGMQASLDGIAKGHIVDQASAVLKAHGVHNHLVNAGGDIRTSGANAKGKPWTIAVEDPAKKADYPDVIRMKNGAVATSGGYEIYFDNEKLFHHIVSPASGLSPQTAVSVTVQADSVLEADALSTAVFVMPPKQGLAFINSLPGRECLVIDPAGAQYASRNWGKAVLG